MAERSQALAERFEQAVAEFIGAVEGLSEVQWQMVCPNEERSIGVLTHHVAAAIPFELAVFREIAAGHQPVTVSGPQLDEMNAHDAERWATTSKEETLALLRGNATAAAAEVRHLTQEQLARTGKYITDVSDEWTVEQWLERVLIGHIHGHLDSIRMVLAGETTTGP